MRDPHLWLLPRRTQLLAGCVGPTSFSAPGTPARGIRDSVSCVSADRLLDRNAEVLRPSWGLLPDRSRSVEASVDGVRMRRLNRGQVTETAQVLPGWV
jgi:hypothetical protein